MKLTIHELTYTDLYVLFEVMQCIKFSSIRASPVIDRETHSLRYIFNAAPRYEEQQWTIFGLPVILDPTLDENEIRVVFGKPLI
jgi:hypothetical protein